MPYCDSHRRMIQYPQSLKYGSGGISAQRNHPSLTLGALTTTIEDIHMKKSLVILTTEIASRFGEGVKQLTLVDGHGYLIANKRKDHDHRCK